MQSHWGWLGWIPPHGRPEAQRCTGPLKEKKKKSSNNWLWNRCISKSTRELLFLIFHPSTGNWIPLGGFQAGSTLGSQRGKQDLRYLASSHPAGTKEAGPEGREDEPEKSSSFFRDLLLSALLNQENLLQVLRFLNLSFTVNQGLRRLTQVERK